MKKNLNPPDYFIGNSSLQRYHLAEYYNDILFDERFYPYIFDASTARYYGLKNTNGLLVYPKEEYLKPYESSSGIYYKNLFFVIDAFDEFKKYYDKYFEINKLQKNMNVYTSIEHSGGAKTLDDLYINYINYIYRSFKTYLDDSMQIKIRNFKDFSNHLVNFLTEVIAIGPITRSGFIESQYCDTLLNGLIISVDSTNKDSTMTENINRYLNDQNFNIFLETAKRFGFMVDKHAPWRIVADLDSPAMKKYYEPYGLIDKEDIFKKLYFHPYESDKKALRAIIISFWNTYVEKAETVVEVDSINNCDKHHYTISRPLGVEESLFDRYYGDPWFIRLFIYLRVLESNIEITQTNFESFVNQALMLAKYNGETASNEYIANRINKDSGTVKLTKLEELGKVLQQRPTGTFKRPKISF
jgi:hypothetical protein